MERQQEMDKPETIIESCQRVAPELVQAGLVEIMEQNAQLWERIYALEKENRELREKAGE